MQQLCANDDCKSPFEPRRSDARFCSATCRSRARRVPGTDDPSSSLLSSSHEPAEESVEPHSEGSSTAPLAPPARLSATSPATPPAPPDLSALEARYQRLASRLMSLEHSAIDEKRLETVQEALRGLERRLEQLLGRQQEAVRSQDGDLPRSIQKEVVNLTRKVQEMSARPDPTAELSTLLERLRRVEQRPLPKPGPVLPEGLMELPRRVERLEQQTSVRSPALPAWLPGLPERMRQLELRSAQSLDTLLPAWLTELPRRMQALEARVPPRGASQEWPAGLTELPLRIRTLERSLEALRSESLESNLVGSAQKLEALERKVTALPRSVQTVLGGVVGRVESLESSVQTLSENVSSLQEEYQQLVNHLQGHSSAEDTEEDEDTHDYSDEEDNEDQELLDLYGED